MRSFIPALLLLLSTSCAALGDPPCGSDGEADGVMCESELTATVTVSSAFPAEHQHWAFQGAADQWALVTGRTAVRFVVVDGPADIEPGTPVCDGRAFDPTDFAGNNKQAALHYLGHRFGLGHSHDGANLMNPPDAKYDYINELSVRDVAHFDLLYAARLP